MTHPSLCALREGTRRLLSTLLVCVGAIALMQAGACPSPGDVSSWLSSPTHLATSASQSALTAGSIAEDPPDNDDDGDDDVIGSAAVLPDRPSSGAIARARYFTPLELRPARQLGAGCRALRAPPRDRRV